MAKYTFFVCFFSKHWKKEQVWPFCCCRTADSQIDAGHPGRHQLHNNGSLVLVSTACSPYLVLRVDEEVQRAAWLLPDDRDPVALLELVEVESVVVDDGGAVVHDAVARHHPRARAQVRHRRREVKLVRGVRGHA